jgi:hypothetical protein
MLGTPTAASNDLRAAARSNPRLARALERPEVDRWPG